MIAVVTGSSGFIGSHLVDALLARHATVRALARPETPVASLDPRVEHCTVDLLDDRSVREAGCWEGVTHVFHLAGVTKRRTLAQFRDGNVVPTANLLAAAVARGGSTPPRVVLVSSQAAAGPAKAPLTPIRETDVPRPIEGYGRSKLEAEQAARLYDGRLPVTVIRPAAVYGPRDRDFLRAFRLAASRVAIHAIPRDNQFSIVHVRDLVTAILLGAESAAAVGRTYFVANETSVSWRGLYSAVATAASSAPAIDVQIPLPAIALAGVAGDVVSALTGWHSLANGHKTRLARPRWWLCDSARARAELGWRETIPLQDGVRETYLWYREAGWMRARPRAARRSSTRGVAGVSTASCCGTMRAPRASPTLVELLEYRAALQPADVVFRFVSGDGSEEGTLTFGELRDRAQVDRGRARRARGTGRSGGAARSARPGLRRVVLRLPVRRRGRGARLPAQSTARRSACGRHRRRFWRARGARQCRARLSTGGLARARRRLGRRHLARRVRAGRWRRCGLARQRSIRRLARDAAVHVRVDRRAARRDARRMRNLLQNSAVIHRVSGHREGDNGVFWLPPFHDMGLIGGILQPVYAGRSAALMSPATFLQRPLRWLEAMSRYRATTSGAPNFAYDLCVERTTEEERAALDLSAWRTSFNGAEPIRADTIARFTEAFAVSGLRRDVDPPLLRSRREHADRVGWTSGSRAAHDSSES